MNLVRLPSGGRSPSWCSSWPSCWPACWRCARMPRDIFPDLNLPAIYVAQPYGGMDPAQMEGLLTNYYEYHFLYINGIHHVESQNDPGHGPDEAVLPPRHRHGPGDGRDGRLRQPLARLHAAGDRAAVRHAVRRRQRAGRLPRPLERDASRSARSRTRRSFKVRPMFASLPGVSAPPPFGGSQRTVVVRVDPDRLRAYNMSPDEVVARRSTTGNIDQPVGQRPHRRPDADRADQRDGPATSRSWRRSRSGSAGRRPSTSATSATVEDATDIPTGYALVNGRRAVYILVTKRADASTLAVVNAVKANLPKMQAVLPDDIKVSFEFDQSPYVTRAIAGLVDRRGCSARC